jgi:hypothetical protein
MLQSVNELRLALGTPIAQRELLELDVPDSSSAFAFRIQPAELIHLWERARARIDVTGRWPVAMTAWLGSGSWSHQMASAKLFDRACYSESAKDASPQALVAGADGVDVNAFVQTLIARSPFFDGDEPEESEEDEPSGGEYPELDWFEPSADQSTELVLLPTPRSWESLAYHSWYAMEGQPSSPFIALLRSWERRYGAELVAHWGTMLQLVVANPPRTLEDATALAREHIAVAPCTTALPGLSIASYARALVGRTTWFLHERP